MHPSFKQELHVLLGTIKVLTHIRYFSERTEIERNCVFDIKLQTQMSSQNTVPFSQCLANE